MSERRDSKLRELTYRLVAMAPEAPPFPEETMVQVQKPSTPARPARTRRPVLVLAAAAALVALGVGVPVLLFGGSDPTPTVPPATAGPQPVTTVPATTVATTQVLELGRIEDPATGAEIISGTVVTIPRVVVTGSANPEATITVGGLPAQREAESFRGEIGLTEGLNTVVIGSEFRGQTAELSVDLRYLPDATVEFAYLTKVGRTEIVADYAQWLTGAEANQAAFEDGVIGSVEEGVPNDYYIRNVNSQLRTLPVAPDAIVILSTSAQGPVTSTAVSIDDWLTLFKEDGTPWNYDTDTVPEWPEPDYGFFGAGTVYAPYWLTLDATGTVVQIQQQYLP